MIYNKFFGYNLSMNKSKLAILIDSCFATMLIFITLFFWFRKHIKSAFLLFFICILLSLLAFVIIFRYFIKKYNLNNITQKESKHLKNCLNFLKFSPNETTSAFFKNLLNSKQIKNHIFENDEFLFFINLRTPLNLNNFFEALDLHFSKHKTIIFICEKFEDDFKALAESNFKNLQIFLPNDLYSLMKSTNLFPVNLESHKTFKQKINDKILLFLSTITKKHFKDYLFSGLSLLTISFFIPFSFYYAIAGTILIILSIICFLKPSASINKNKISLIDTIKK